MKKFLISFVCVITLCIIMVACESTEEPKTEGEAVVTFTAELPRSMVNRAPQRTNNDSIIVTDSIEE